jgi:hypothetical protein
LDRSNALRLTSKQVISGALITLGLLFAAGFVLYALAYPPGYFECMARPVVIEYSLFAFPCLAGIVVGAGFVIGKTQEEINRSIDLRAYLISVAVLWVAYVVFLFDHPRPVVIVWLSLLGASAALVGLLAATFARATWKPAVASKGSDSGGLPCAEEGRGTAPRLEGPGALLNVRMARRRRLIHGTQVDSLDGMAVTIFAAFLLIQLFALSFSPSDSTVHLRTTNEDAEKIKKCPERSHADTRAHEAKKDEKGAVGQVVSSNSLAHGKETRLDYVST